jgi:hypothetical protein
MTHVVKLDLAPVPSDLAQELIDYLQQVPLDLDRKRWLDEFHEHNINSVAHAFFPAPDDWQKRICDLYQPCFDKHEISVAFGIMKNTTMQSGCLPPHADRARSLALNYYLELGGNDVRTVFYDQTAPTFHEATNFSYQQVNQIDQQVFDSAWYAYDVNQVHSVENIEGNRFILILLISAPYYQLDNLITDYPDLICPTI